MRTTVCTASISTTSSTHSHRPAAQIPSSVKGIPQKLILVTVKANALAQLAPLPRAQLPRTPPLQPRHYTQPHAIAVTLLSKAITMHKP